MQQHSQPGMTAATTADSPMPPKIQRSDPPAVDARRHSRPGVTAASAVSPMLPRPGGPLSASAAHAQLPNTTHAALCANGASQRAAARHVRVPRSGLRPSGGAHAARPHCARLSVSPPV
eukprot:1136861-Pelagomonas_calceolata.AAC.14